MKYKKKSNSEKPKKVKENPKDTPSCFSFGKFEFIDKYEFIEKALEKIKKEIKQDEN